MNFDCKRCGKCCRFKVRLSSEDISRIKEKGHDDFFFVEGEKFFLKKKYGYCLFLKLVDGIPSCSIDNYKPIGCKEFPFKIENGEILFDPRCSAFNAPKVLFGKKTD